MKRKVVAALAALSLVAVFTSPVMADLTPFPGDNLALVDFQQFAGGARTHQPLHMGILNGAGTALLSPYQTVNTNASGLITVTFAFTWPYAQPYPSPFPTTYPGQNFRWATLGFRVGIGWDSSEVTIIGGSSPAGPMTLTPLNWSTATLPTSLSGFSPVTPGTVTVAPFVNRVSPGTAVHPGGFAVKEQTVGGINPIMRLTAHAHNPVFANSLLDVFLGGGLYGFGPFISGRFFTDSVFHQGFTTTITTRIWTSVIATNSIFLFTMGDAGVKVTPEPASAGLFGAGLLALVGGFWRRRRRQA